MTVVPQGCLDIHSLLVVLQSVAKVSGHFVSLCNFVQYGRYVSVSATQYKYLHPNRLIEILYRILKLAPQLMTYANAIHGA
jgi:hypothetical protein